MDQPNQLPLSSKVQWKIKHNKNIRGKTMNILQKLFGKKSNTVKSYGNEQNTAVEVQVSKEQIKSQEETLSVPQPKHQCVGGFNQETWDKVEHMSKESGVYVQKYGENIAMSVFQHLKTDNSFEIYKNGIVTYCKEIDILERRCNVTPACANGCSYCCQQVIYLTETEKEVVKKKLSLLSKEEQEQVREKNNEIMKVVRENNIPLKLDMASNKLDTINKKYMKLKMPCSLLDDNNSCRVYEVRPTSCWIYKNYGHKEDCNGKIAEHSYPFLEYAQLLLGPFMSLNILQGKQINTTADLLPKVIYDLLK